MRIDAHQHYWSVQRGDYGWLTPADAVLYRDFAPDDLSEQLADCAVSATVLVQAAPTEAETRYLLALARQHPSVAGVVGWVDFEASDVAHRMRHLVQEGAGALKGLRPMIQDITDPHWLDRPTLDAAFEATIENDLAFDALVSPKHLEPLARRLRRHPGLRAVLDHAGKPDIARGALEPWARGLEALARGSTIYCKLSGLLTQASPGATAAQLDAFVERIFDCFGAQRVMWGSDWPVLLLRGSYRRWLQIALELVHRHAPGQEEAVFATNAMRFYRLELPGRHALRSSQSQR
ncbi:MAG: amidohydrolase family protein [Steroidobacteraceae bacterium]|jgi:L-fuconolactonase